MRSISGSSKSTIASVAEMRMSMSGCAASKCAQPRQQPQRRERGEGGHADMPPPARAADLAHRGVQALQQRHHAAQQLHAGAGELDLARAAHEQRRAEFVFERLDLAADGRLRQVQLLGRGAKNSAAAPPPRRPATGPRRARGGVADSCADVYQWRRPNSFDTSPAIDDASSYEPPSPGAHDEPPIHARNATPAGHRAGLADAPRRQRCG